MADTTIGTSADAAYASVDAANIALTFTPERTGYYRAVFTFTHVFVFTATTEGQCEVTFRITDGTNVSFAARSGGYFPATAANGIRLSNPITITHIFNFNWLIIKSISF